MLIYSEALYSSYSAFPDPSSLPLWDRNSISSDWECWLFPISFGEVLGLAGRYTQVEASVVNNKGSVSFCLRNPGCRVMDRHIFLNHWVPRVK